MYNKNDPFDRDPQTIEEKIAVAIGVVILFTILVAVAAVCGVCGTGLMQLVGG